MASAALNSVARAAAAAFRAACKFVLAPFQKLFLRAANSSPERRSIVEQLEFEGNSLAQEKAARRAQQERDFMASLPAEVRELMLRTELPKLGVLHIDSDYLSTPGDIGHPESYAFPVVYRVVPGLTFDAVQSGKLTPRVEADFIDAVKYLDAQGVSCITGDCGFFFWFTELAKKHTAVPVVLSTLMLIPTLTKSLSDTVYIAILTSNGKSLEPMRPLIKRTAGVDLSQERFIILGCEDVEGFDAVAKGSKVDVWRVTLPMVRLALQALVAEPRIKAIVCECTQLPPFGDALRAYTGLPVYTSITACNMAMEGLLAQNLTLSSWQDVHHKHATEPYTFGQVLDE